jgi:hypothetical protein|tara:strand:- start:287 stop:550 length:264 start_codon:yes stop_codon:yes gene_type:complete
MPEMWSKGNNRDCKNNLPLFQMLLGNNKRRIKERRMGSKFEKTVVQDGSEGLIYAQALKEAYPWIKIVPWLLIVLLMYGCAKLSGVA